MIDSDDLYDYLRHLITEYLLTDQICIEFMPNWSNSLLILLFNNTPFYSIQDNSIQLHSISLNNTQFHSIPLNSTQFHSIPINSTIASFCICSMCLLNFHGIFWTYSIADELDECEDWCWDWQRPPVAPISWIVEPIDTRLDITTPSIYRCHEWWLWMGKCRWLTINRVVLRLHAAGLLDTERKMCGWRLLLTRVIFKSYLILVGNCWLALSSFGFIGTSSLCHVYVDV